MYDLNFDIFSFFVKNRRNFRQKLKFFSRIEIFIKNRRFWHKSKFLTKIDEFDNNRNFWQKSIPYVKNRNFLLKIELFLNSRNVWQKSIFWQFFSIFDAIYYQKPVKSPAYPVKKTASKRPLMTSNFRQIRDIWPVPVLINQLNYGVAKMANLFAPFEATWGQFTALRGHSIPEW